MPLYNTIELNKYKVTAYISGKLSDKTFLISGVVSAPNREVAAILFKLTLEEEGFIYKANNYVEDFT